MALSIGIVGLPNVGKSTLFTALTNKGGLAANYPFATIEPNVGIVPVPDARMDRLAGGAALPEGFSLRMLGPQDAQAVIGLEVQIDEFADSFRGVDREEKVEECRENLTRGGHAFGVYDGDRLVALAETTAENSVSAMVVGVATLPGWRGRGFARACVHAAAAHSFAAGRRYLCLFYDNPAAGRIYHALGFADVGRFGMAMPE